MTTKQLLAEVTALPVKERALLAEALLRSLNSSTIELDAQWAATAQRRLLELRSGKAKAIPADQVFAKVWQ